MPNDGDHVNPALVSSLLNPKGLWHRRFIKSEPLLVGVAWFVLVQVALVAVGTTGHIVNPALSKWLSLGAGAVAFLVSRAHVVVLGLRLLGLRVCYQLGLTDKASYVRLRKSVEQAFVDRVADSGDYGAPSGGGKR
jgi:hypothetical protein